MVSAGMDLRHAVREARQMGFSIEILRRTGEYKISPPGGGRILRVNSRRKDAPRSLVAAIKRAGG